MRKDEKRAQNTFHPPSSLHRVCRVQNILAVSWGNRRAGLCTLQGVFLLGAEVLGKLRNRCNAASCLLRHSCTALYFQGTGNGRVTVNTIAWEHLCGQAAGKGDPEEVFEKCQIFHKSPMKSLNLVISTLFYLPPCFPGGREEHDKGFASGAALCLFMVALLHDQNSYLHGVKVPLRCSPQAAGAPGWAQWPAPELLHKAVGTKCSSGLFHQWERPSRHGRAGVSPSVLRADSPSGGHPQSAAFIVYLGGLLGKESEMTGVKGGTES